jgi:cytoskeleton protein RodZ
VKQMLPNNMEDEQLSGDANGQVKPARSLGAILRSAREARAMTIREVSDRIRIPTQYLMMLEANDYTAIADELYLLPFVRSYADFLGLEAGVLSARFLCGIQPVERAVDQDAEPVEERTAGRSRWFTTAAVMLFVALALYLVGFK